MIRSDTFPAPRSVYMDCSATTPVDPEVLEAMLPYFSEVFANPSGAYSLGRQARRALEEARATVAGILGCRPEEVVFTSGGSESDNLALRGAARAMRDAGRGAHCLSGPIEHEAILATFHDLEAHEGFDLTVLDVDHHGQVAVDQVVAAVRPDTVLLSLMLANNEVGSLQPVAAIGAALRPRGILVHTDAVQAGAWVDLDVDRLNVDLLSLSAHKFYGPKGVGVLYVREGTPLVSCQTGGGHEFGRRAGTENVAGAVGLARALELTQSDREAACIRAAGLRDRLISGLAAIDGVVLTGHPTERLAGHASVCVAGVPADALILGLDMRGICASSGSACSSGKVAASHVLTAMGVDAELARGALRLSLGRHTSAEDVDHVIAVLTALVPRLRAVARTVAVGA
ncbi:MAG: cysteine desulfurase [Ardenticatenia bacterium]|nr:cysteine desulfurase [Ardenticatenia bacterium]